MADDTLPEGTDTILNENGVDEKAADGRAGSAGPAADRESGLITGDGSSNRASGVKEAFRTGSDKLRSTANDRAMGLVSQGIERSSGALTNVSALIGDTAASLDERLGEQYGDYARSAAKAVERAANSLATKDPDELFEDARTLVRKSPAVALAGAAILGFALVRVVKSGLDSGDRSTSRSGKGR